MIALKICVSLVLVGFLVANKGEYITVSLNGDKYYKKMGHATILSQEAFVQKMKSIADHRFVPRKLYFRYSHRDTSCMQKMQKKKNGIKMT